MTPPKRYMPWNKGKIGIYSEEYRKKISAGLKGKRKPPRSEEHRKNLSKALKGHEVSEETRKKISQAQIGREISEETRRKLSEAKKGSKHPLWGKRHTEETKNKMRDTKINQYRNNSELIIRISNSVKKLWRDSEYHKKHTGPNHHWWKGGITKREETLAHALRAELRNWAKEVLERNNYTCQRCGIRSEGKRVMQVHHIKSVLEYPSLVLDIANGITLCKNCHRNTESYGRKLKNIIYESNK